MKITENAATQLKNFLNQYNDENMGIRIFEAQGCCGSSIQMDIAPNLGSNEILVNLNDINFFVQESLIKKLETVTIDFSMQGFILQGLEKNKDCCC